MFMLPAIGSTMTQAILFAEFGKRGAHAFDVVERQRDRVLGESRWYARGTGYTEGQRSRARA